MKFSCPIRLNQKGVVHFLLPLILILGLIAAVYLITSGNPLKLFSKASNPPIVFKDINGSFLPEQNGIPQTTAATVRVELTSTLGPPITSKINLAAEGETKPALSIAPIFRLYNPRNGDHLYTSNPQERDAASRAGYHFEGIAFYASAMQQAPYAPVYRFYNPRTGEHFYTANQNEANNVRRYGFSPEGIAFYASVSPVAGLVPVYRFIYLPSSLHFYTASESEKSSLLSNRAYRLEEVAFFVPANSKPIPPVPTKAPVSVPITSGTLSYRIAETPTDLDAASWQNYDSEPKVFNYTFQNSTPGQKFLWVDFKDSTGRTDRKSAQIELTSPTPSSTPSSTSSSKPDVAAFRSALYYDYNKPSPSLSVLGSSKIGSFGSLTMEAWVKIKENTKIREGYPIIYKSAPPFAYLLSITKDKKLKFTYAILYQGRWAPTEIVSNSTITPDQWTHVAVMYYTGQPRCITGQCKSDDMLNKIGLYINGQEVATQEQIGVIGGGNDRGNVIIGSNGLDYFSGMLDEVRISNFIQYLGPSFNVPYAPFVLNAPPLQGIAPGAVLLLCHFDENNGNPACENSVGEKFNTIATDLSYVQHCTDAGCETIIATPSPSSSPIPTKWVHSSITTSNNSWPTYSSGDYKSGTLNIEYNADQYFNVYYWLEFNSTDCPIAGVYPGYYSYTKTTTKFTQSFNVSLLSYSSAKHCKFTLKGKDLFGAYVPDASITVTLNP